MLDARYFARLARLKLAVDKKSNASLLGSRKSVRKGSSAEFSDFREYMPGDDIRAIDWNAYARLDRLYIKEYMEEKESSVSLFIDLSKSMDYGEEKTKLDLQEEIAAALAYIALMNMDHVGVFDLGDTRRRHIASGGKAGFSELTEWLDRLETGESVDIFHSVSTVGRMQPGLSVIMSDFLSEEYVDDPDKLTQLIRYLQYRKQKVVVLHILAKEEIDIEHSGTFFLIDSENKDSRLRVTMESASIRSYQDALNEFMDGLRRSAKRCGASYHLCSTGVGFDKIIFDELKEIYEF